MSHYDLTKLRAMAQGNEAFVQRMIGVFLEHTPEQVRQITEYFHNHNLPKVSALAHKIKPSIDLMGIEELKTVIREIELKAKENQEDDLPSLIDRLNTIINLVFKDISKELAA